MKLLSGSVRTQKLQYHWMLANGQDNEWARVVILHHLNWGKLYHDDRQQESILWRWRRFTDSNCTQLLTRIIMELYRFYRPCHWKIWEWWIIRKRQILDRIRWTKRDHLIKDHFSPSSKIIPNCSQEKQLA